MKKKWLYKTCFILGYTILIVFQGYNSYSQDITSFYLDNVPQTNLLNPAIQPKCNFYFGIPVLSRLDINLSNSDFRYSDFLDQQSTIESDSTSDIMDYFDEIKGKVKNVNKTVFQNSIPVLSMGFRVNKMFFSLDVTQKEQIALKLPKDAFNVITFDGTQSSFDLTGLNFDIRMYSEIGVGFSYSFQNFSVGVHPKLYFGEFLLALDANDFRVNMHDSLTDVVFDNTLKFASAVPFVTDTEGIIDLDMRKGIIDPSVFEDSKMIWKGIAQNRGLGIDFGIDYRPIEKLDVSVSVTDLGYIKWKSCANELTAKFETISFIDSTGENEMEGNTQLLPGIALDGTANPFITSMTPNLYIGCRYFIIPQINVGVLSKMAFYQGFTNHNFALCANFSPVDVLNLNLSYQLFNGKYNSLGFGFAVRLGVINFYGATDDFSIGKSKEGKIGLFKNQGSYNFRFGINIVVGDDKNEKEVLEYY